MKTKITKNPISKISLLVFSFVIVCGLSLSAYAANDTDLSITISGGILNVDIVDAGGTTVANPSVTMDSVDSTLNKQISNGTLGVTSEKIRLSNSTTTPTWTTTIAATNGASAVWSSTGSATMDYNSTVGGTGSLAVKPSGATIVAVNNGNTTGVSKGTDTAFGAGTGSITLYSANGTAAVSEQYDLTNVVLSQEVPLSQAAASYTINMTLTAI